MMYDLSVTHSFMKWQIVTTQRIILSWGNVLLLTFKLSNKDLIVCWGKNDLKVAEFVSYDHIVNERASYILEVDPNLLHNI